ncbi:MAG: hypothetical protein MRECE_15c025 [Mycoplasmataceae bacterium CE_OT135]|nr:MAG: hypothetical protein MRECE_15c025 [Mycoplasmataceae bacterium CE_OT135]
MMPRIKPKRKIVIYSNEKKANPKTTPSQLF